MNTSWRKTARVKLWMGNMPKKQIEQIGPLVIDRSEGIYLYDNDGDRYIDAMSGAWVVNVGHGRKAIADAMHQQAKKMPFVLNEGYTNQTTLQLTERLLNMVPGNFDRVFFTSGGSEAVETALKMVRQKWAVQGTPKHKVIARSLSYHGATWGAMSVSGFPDWRWPFAPPVPGASFINPPTCYRCPFNKTYPDCGVECATELETAIVKANPEKVGAVIAEPISAASSAHVPPAEYWGIIRSICSKYEIPLISDEIVTGFGRTGKMFGMEHWNITPDIMVIGKGVTSGYSPLAAVLAPKEITDALDEDGFVHGFTFSGHPVACAAALANIQILTDENLTANAASQGKYLKQILSSELEESEIVGDIRGKGLLLSIELVKDRSTQERFSNPSAVAEALKPIFMEHKVLCRVGPQIRLGPPLSISKAEIEQLAEGIISSIREFEFHAMKSLEV